MEVCAGEGGCDVGLGGGEDVDDEVGWEVFEGVVGIVGVGV